MGTSLIDRINNYGATKSAYVGSYGGFGDFLYRQASSNRYELQDRKYDLALAYLYIEPVRDSVNLFVDAMSRIPTQLVRNTTGNEDDDEVIASTADVGKPRHIALEIFKNHKNKYYTAYFAQQMLEWRLYDEIATELIRPIDNAQLREIARLNQLANGVKVLRGAALTVSGYSGQIRQFYYASDDPDDTTLDPQDVAYVRGYHPLSDYHGSSDLLAVLAEMNIIQDTRNNARRILKKAHRPDVFASAATDNGQATRLTEQEVDRVKRAVNEYKQNEDSTIMILGAPLRFDTVPPPNPANQVPISEDARKAIFRVLGVNPDLLGDSGTVNYKQEPGIYANFITNQVKPALDTIYSYNNDHILPQLPNTDETMRLKPDLSMFDVVTEPEYDYIEVQTKALDTGAITYGSYGEKTNQDIPDLIKNMIKIEGIPVPIEEVGNLWKYKFQAPAVEQFASAESDMAEAEAKPLEVEAQVTEAEKPEPVPEPPTPLQDDSEVEEEAPEPEKSVKELPNQREAFAYIPLANDSTVLRIQRQLKEQYTGESIKWEAAPTLHVTLCYATAISDRAIQEMSKLIRPMQVELQANELNYFDTPDGKAVHIKLGNTTALSELQANVYSAFEDEGDGLSEYSIPDNYQPHITLGYFPNELAFTPQSIPEINILADSVIVGRDDYDPVLILKAPVFKSAHTHDYPHKSLLIADTLYPDDDTMMQRIQDELKTWYSFEKKRYGKKDTRIFESAVLEPYLKFAIIDRIDNVDTVDGLSSAILDVFEDDAVKTKDSYRRQARSLFKKLWASEYNTSEFVRGMGKLIEQQYTQAFKQGVYKAGQTLDDLSGDELAELDLAILDEKSNVFQIMRDIMEDRIREDVNLNKYRTRAELWIARYDRILDLGYVIAMRDAPLLWEYNERKEHCVDCQNLNGRIYKASIWRKLNIEPKSARLACFGAYCGCNFRRPPEGSAITRGRPPRIRGN